jgi:TIR domain-containing protein
VTESKAVFLSYAAQDAEAAARIFAAFRTTGVEVWLDQSELRGVDVCAAIAATANYYARNPAIYREKSHRDNPKSLTFPKTRIGGS